MLVEPLVHVGSVVRREVVHDDVTAPWGVDGVNEVEQIDERVAVVLVRRKPKGLPRRTSNAPIQQSVP